MFWFSYTVLHGRLVIMDVTEISVNGVRCYLAAWSEDPRINVTEYSSDLALARLTAHLERRLVPAQIRITFLPQSLPQPLPHPLPQPLPVHA